jgi:hypothetical protein
MWTYYAEPDGGTPVAFADGLEAFSALTMPGRLTVWRENVGELAIIGWRRADGTYERNPDYRQIAADGSVVTSDDNE